MKHSSTIIRLLIAACLVGAVGGFFALGGQHLLTLDALKSSQLALEHYHLTHPCLLAAGFFLAYVTVTALSLPLATLLTLAAGALFGFWEGTLLVSFAS
ncbi:MAG: pyridine nucleotide-disulfide oxidoreductase, partial [Rhodanobacter sp.]